MTSLNRYRMASDDLPHPLMTSDDLPHQVREWFTWYKALDANGKRIPDSEPNVFGFEGRPVDTAATAAVIETAHASWKSLVLRQVPRGKCVLA